MIGSNLVLNRLFTQYVFSDLIKNYHNNIYHTVVRKFVSNDTADKNGSLIYKIYKYMSKYYRNEYFYQNTILNKLLLGRHSLKTTTALTQIPINKSKADFILINGKAVVYEIKTELDSFDRLKNQIADYYKAFSYVCVVTCERNYEKINTLLSDSPVGICILTDNNTLSFRKEPKEYEEELNHNVIFKILHKSEFENVIKEFYGKLPKTTQVFYYGECFNSFSRIPISVAYKLSLRQLKNRNKVINDKFEEVPYELRSLMYFYNATASDYARLERFLDEKFGG